MARGFAEFYHAGGDLPVRDRKPLVFRVAHAQNAVILCGVGVGDLNDRKIFVRGKADHGKIVPAAHEHGPGCWNGSPLDKTGPEDL